MPRARVSRCHSRSLRDRRLHGQRRSPMCAAPARTWPLRWTPDGRSRAAPGHSRRAAARGRRKSSARRGGGDSRAPGGCIGGSGLAERSSIRAAACADIAALHATCWSRALGRCCLAWRAGVDCQIARKQGSRCGFARRVRPNPAQRSIFWPSTTNESNAANATPQQPRTCPSAIAVTSSARL